MIDLHLHTTASDGRSTPAALVREAAAAGLTVLAVTDHDTTAAVRTVAAAARAAGLAAVPGIEITAVEAGRDVHVLGYFLDPDDPALLAFLESQRALRRTRLGQILDRLDGLGIVLDRSALAPGDAMPGRAVGRPLVARALVDAGHARDIADAFDRWLGEGRPAFVGRSGEPVADVIDRIARAGGVASIAHPGKTRVDHLIPDLVRRGLAAIEVFHPDHSADDIARYTAVAAAHGLLMTGGSDYHGPGSGRAAALGVVNLPDPQFRALATRAGWSGPWPATR